MVAALAGPAFEYTHFTFQNWYAGDNWSSLADSDRYLGPQAQQYFWDNYEGKIRAELQRMQLQGWETVEPIGASAIKLRRSESTDHAIDPADILLWVMTLGVALLTYLLFERPRRYVSYTPVEFRVKMHRLISIPMTVTNEALAMS